MAAPPLGIIDRSNQRKAAETAIQAIQEGHFCRIIEFYGIYGSGKTAVLNEIESMIRAEPVAAARVDLENFQDDSASFRIQLMTEIDNQLAARTGHLPGNIFNPLDTSSSKIDISTLRAIVKEVAAFYRDKGSPLVLLFDNAHLCDPELFKWLGRELIYNFYRSLAGPVGLLVILVGAGRVVKSHWGANFYAYEMHSLDGFSIHDTKEHVHQLTGANDWEQVINDIYDLSTGIPGLNAALIELLTNIQLLPAEMQEEKANLANMLFTQSVLPGMLADMPPDMEEFIRVASVMRRFDERVLKELFKYNGSSGHMHVYREHIDKLIERPCFFIERTESQPPFRFAPALRRVIEFLDSLRNPSDRERLHLSAKSVWQEFMLGREFYALRGPYSVELLYHIARINRRSPPEMMEEQIISRLDDLINSHYVPTVRNTSELTDLQDSLKFDAELNELLGEALINKLIARIHIHTRMLPDAIQTFHLAADRRDDIWMRMTMRTSDGGRIGPIDQRAQVHFKLDEYRNDFVETGRSAYAVYMATDVDEFLATQNANTPIELETTMVDVAWELLVPIGGNDPLCIGRAFTRRSQGSKVHYERPRLDKLHALVIGDPSGDLTFAAEEAQAIENLLVAGGYTVDLLVGPSEANMAAVVRQLSNNWYDLIHFAGHCDYDKNEEETYLLLGANERLYSAEFANYLHCHPFLFLNACRGGRQQAQPIPTATSRQLFIDGLGSRAVQRGAVGFIASLWDISDEQTYHFATTFYQRACTRGTTIAESVLYARRDAREQYPNSDLWAAWVLYASLGQRIVEK